MVTRLWVWLVMSGLVIAGLGRCQRAGNQRSGSSVTARTREYMDGSVTESDVESGKDDSEMWTDAYEEEDEIEMEERPQNMEGTEQGAASGTSVAGNKTGQGERPQKAKKAKWFAGRDGNAKGNKTEAKRKPQNMEEVDWKDVKDNRTLGALQTRKKRHHPWTANTRNNSVTTEGDNRTAGVGQTPPRPLSSPGNATNENLTLGDKLMRLIGLENFTRSNKTTPPPPDNLTQPTRSVPGPGGDQGQARQVNTTDTRENKTQPGKVTEGPINNTALPPLHLMTQANRSVPRPAEGTGGALQGQERQSNATVWTHTHRSPQPNQSVPGSAANVTALPHTHHATQPNQSVSRSAGVSGDLQGHGQSWDDEALVKSHARGRHQAPPKESHQHPARKWLSSDSKPPLSDGESRANSKFKAPVDSSQEPAYRKLKNSPGNSLIPRQHSACKRPSNAHNNTIRRAGQPHNSRENNTLQEARYSRLRRASQGLNNNPTTTDSSDDPLSGGRRLPKRRQHAYKGLSDGLLQYKPWSGKHAAPETARKGSTNTPDTHSRDIPLSRQHKIPKPSHKGVSNNPDKHSEDIPLSGEHKIPRPSSKGIGNTVDTPSIDAPLSRNTNTKESEQKGFSNDTERYSQDIPLSGDAKLPGL